jgi:hypothetical protein
MGFCKETTIPSVIINRGLMVADSSKPEDNQSQNEAPQGLNEVDRAVFGQGIGLRMISIRTLRANDHL